VAGPGNGAAPAGQCRLSGRGGRPSPASTASLLTCRCGGTGGVSLVISHVATWRGLDHFINGVPLENLAREDFAWQEARLEG
jgi:hypothetical protein